jgi:hypothetical protein
MQLNCTRLFVAAIFALLAMLAHADTFPEFIHAAPQVKQSKLRQANNFFLRQKLYFARKHRIVTVDFDALGAPGTNFTMTLFPNLVLTVQTLSMQADPTNPNQNFWRGKIVGMRENNKDVSLDGFDDEDLGLAFSFGYIFPEVTPELSEEVATDAASGFGTDILRPAEQATKPRIGVRVVGAQIDIPFHRDPIFISAVAEDPRFHVIYEEDLDKRPERGDNKAEKARKYREFLDALDNEKREYESERSGKK